MSKISKIVLVNNIKEPIVIISESPYVYKGFKLTKDVSVGDYYPIPNDEIISFDSYHGKKLEVCNAYLNNYITISNLHVREIGEFTEKGYFNLLKKYVASQVSVGGKEDSYLSVRTEVHDQLIKMMKKNFSGV